VDFRLSPEQLLIKDSVLRFAQKPLPADPWAEFAQLGWLALGAPEELGGFGGAIETMLVMEALGRGAVLEPLNACATFPGAILRAAGRYDLLESLCDGSRRFAVAYEEEDAPYDPSAVRTLAQRTADGYRLRGRKVRVVVQPEATTFLVSARAGERVGLFAVAPGAAGAVRRDAAAEDGVLATSLDLDGVVLDDAASVGPPGEGLALLEYGLEHAIGAACAEAVGLMSALFEMTLGYLKERSQFGVPIGSFQALQHRMAEMFIELELARSMAYVAAMTLDGETGPQERARAVRGSKIQIARSGRFIAQNAVQLHGAIAMTAEYRLGRYFKRMTSLERLFGDVDYHLEGYVSLAPSEESVPARPSQTFESLETDTST
jgi:alkylation response protein AidB-like acyl-CoA dehydrogenase